MEAIEDGTDVLCRDCSTVLPYSPFKDGPRFRIVTYPHFPEIRASAKLGCRFCLLRHEALDDMFDERRKLTMSDVRITSEPWPVPNWDRQVVVTNCIFPKGPNQQINRIISHIIPTPPRNDRGEMLGLMWFDLWADAVLGLTRDIGDAAALHGGLRLRLPDRNALSDANIRLVHGWLDNCVAEHACCSTKRLPRLPTRIIDVGSSGGQTPRLVVTNGRPAHYITLSHCWGPERVLEAARNLRLRRSNIQDLLMGIPLGSISQNFQDAIKVVQKLGFRYLWIDALCIIQDSNSDWEYESARMNDVYECSYLTIVATSARSSSEGFLKRPERPSVTIPYRDDLDPTIVGKVHITRGLSGNHPWNLVEETAWNTRGWTYQERMLSRRMLHFSSLCLFWECRSVDSSEINVEKRRLWNRPRWILSQAQDDQAVVEPLDYLHNQYDRWYIVLREFSKRKFTYTSDALPAVSGLARIFQQAYAEKDEYIAGLWRQDFAQGLLWLVDGSSETSKAQEYWAPSWSWASIAGTVHWPTRTIPRHKRDDFTVELLEVNMRVAKENAMGTVLGGYIRMRGRLRSLSVVRKPEEWGAFSRFRYDLWYEDKIVGNGQFDADQDDTAEEVWLLQMAAQQSGDCFYPYHPTVLMLERLCGSQTKFVRLGCGVLDDEQLDFFDICEPQTFDFY